ILSLPHAVTGSLVSDSKQVPKSYISQDGNDIGVKAENDDWKDYLVNQDVLKVLIPLLLLLFLAVPIVGIIYACFCSRCKNYGRASKERRYCCGILLAISAFLMLHCQFSNNFSRTKENGIFHSNFEHMRRLYETDYKHLLGRIEAQSNATLAMVHAEAIKDLSEVLKNMHLTKLILEEFQNELPVAKRLAIRFRDALHAVKLNLKKFLTLQCNQQECGDFYRDNEIRLIDEGCLHFDRIPQTEDFIKSINQILASKFVNYPLMAAQQIATAYRNHTDYLLDTFTKDLHKGADKLQEKYEASLVELKVKTVKTAKATPPSPADALRRKLGPSWYGSTLGMLLLLMLLPILLLIALGVGLFNPNVASVLLCAFISAVFILFSIALILVLFYLVHGFLTYNIFCAGKNHLVPKKTINPTFYSPELRSGDVLQRCVGKESLYGDLGLKELYVHMKKGVRESFEKLEGAPILGYLSSINFQAAAVDRELLGNKLFSYNSSEFTQHICRELVPEPKPGPLLELISKLGNLTRSVGSPPFLVNQTIRLRVAHKKLGQPLTDIIQRLLGKLEQLDHLLSGGNESFARYMSHLLEKIKKFLRRDAKKVSEELAQNISCFVNFGLDNESKEAMESLAQTRHESLDRHPHSQEQKDLNDLCWRIANPMNAIWFWLLPFTLLLLPAVYCSHYLRSRMRSLTSTSADTLISLCEENFVPPCTLPVGLPHSTCCRYLPIVPETNVDQLEPRKDVYVHQRVSIQE
ncbi:hypothetical protein KR059_004989, partial [Drosophila kikkawai]